MVLAVILVGFGLAMILTIQGQIGHSIDQDLLMRGERFQFGPQPPPGGRPFGGPGGGPPQIQGQGPMSGQGQFNGQQPPRSDPPQGPNLFQGPDQQGPRPPIDPDTERMAAFRRPRFLDRSANSVIREEPGGPFDPASFRRSLGGSKEYSSLIYDGEHLRVYSVPWRNGQNIVGVVQLARELTEQDRLWAEQLKTLLLLTPLALLIAGIGGWFLTGKILKPIREVTEAAGAIGEQDLSHRLDVEGSDELAQLAATFNAMIARLEASFQSREEAYQKLQQAFEQQRRFTADASHELRTPLTRIKVSTSAAMMGEQSIGEYKVAIKTADEAADEMSKLIQDLLMLARVDADQLRIQSNPTDLTALVHEAVIGMPKRDSGIHIDSPSTPIEASVDPDLIKRVISNLLDNAVRHTPANKKVSVELTQDENCAVFSVIDEGEGIGREHVSHLTERFYRVDAARNRSDGGLGLGLSICKSIVEAHGGTLTIVSEVGHGTTATVIIPKDEEIASNLTLSK